MPILLSQALSASGVTGPIFADRQITIAWDGANGFGATGPTVDFFDDFRNGTDGVAHGLADPVIGSWDSRPGLPKVVDEQSLTKGLSLKVIDAVMKQIRFAFPGPRTEFFLCYWLRCDINWVDIVAGNFKSTWILDQAGSFSGTDDEYDNCFPQRAGGSGWEVSGNDTQRHWQWTTAAINKDLWHRAALWEKDIESNPDPGPLDMKFFAQRLTPGLANERTDVPNKPTSDPQGMFTVGGGDPPASTSVGLINFPGFEGFGGQAWYDEIYIASGPGAAARVEIGNNSDYDSCTRLAIATITAHSNEEITCTLRDGGFGTFANQHMHITDLDNAQVGTSRLIS